MRSGWENGCRVPVQDDREERPARRADPAALVMARRLVGIMLADTNPALGVECLALVTGIGYQGASMEDIAKRHGVVRATVSKRCVELCEGFGVLPPRAMRSEMSREKCRKARVRELIAS